jgi:outer membrane protein TolC
MVALRKRNGSGRLVQEYDTGVTFSLPWANGTRNRAERLEARLMTEAAAHERAAVEQGVLCRVTTRFHLLASLRDCCALFRDSVLPLARRSLEATLIAYEANQVPFSDVIESHRRWLDAGAGLVSRNRDFFLGQAELDYAAGLVPGISSFPAP